jgi:hypothetical protein
MRMGPSFLYFPRVLSLAEVNTAVCELKNLHIDCTRDQFQNSLYECPISFPETTRSSPGIIKLIYIFVSGFLQQRYSWILF